MTENTRWISLYLFQINPFVFTHEYPDGSSTVFNPENGLAFRFDPISNTIWKKLRTPIPMIDILDDIRNRYTGVPDESLQHITDFLEHLLVKSLIGPVIQDSEAKPIKIPLKFPLYDLCHKQPRIRVDQFDESRPHDDTSVYFYQRQSMVPTFLPGDRLHISRIDPDSIRSGDIVVFYSPTNDERIVHRVIEISEEGLRTRGDNVDSEIDQWVLKPEKIIGIVKICERRGRKQNINGGMIGLLRHHAQRRYIRLLRDIRKLLFPPSLRIHLGSILERVNLSLLLPHRNRPHILVLLRPNGLEMILVWGSRVLGRRPPHSHYWSVGFYYLPFIDNRFIGKAQEIVEGWEGGHKPKNS